MDAESGLDGQEQGVQALALRLRRAVEAAGGNKRVAELAGVPLRTLNSYMAAEADPKVTRLKRIADACATTVDQLLGLEIEASEAGNGTIYPLVDAAPTGFVAVPKLAVRASAGSGLVPTDDQASMMMLRESWLRSLGVAPRNAQFLEAEGDSMEETIFHGDLLLVDRGIDKLMHGFIYVFVVDGLVVVKRLQMLFDGGVVLSSDNPRYAPQTVPPDRKHELVVEGRLVWFGRAI